MSNAGELISAARKRRGLSIKELAAAIGKSAGHLDNIEHRHLRGMPRTLYAAAAYLDIDQQAMRQAYIEDSAASAAALWDQEVYDFHVTECRDKELV